MATLVEAGGWLEGVHLLSNGLVEKNEFGADAVALLHQPSVLAYFTEFLRKSAPAEAGDEYVKAVLAEMEKLAEIAKKDVLSGDDVKAVAGHTQTILSRF